MRNVKVFLGALAVSLTLGAAVNDARADIVFQGGNINDAANWLNTDDGTTGAFPTAGGPVGIVDIDANFLNTAANNAFTPTGDIIFGGTTGPITLSAGIDLVASNPNSLTFNNVIVNAGDDIFTGGGSAGNVGYIFNDGSVTNVDDDFEANGGGTITINGGIHTLGIAPTGGSNFGAQNDGTLNFLGGSVTGVDLFRTTNAGAVLNIGGDASIDTADVSFANGTVDIATDWTGFLALDGTTTAGAFESLLIGSGVTLDGVAIDATVFTDNFGVNGAGALVLTTAVPEPTSAVLLGLVGIGMVVRRRK